MRLGKSHMERLCTFGTTRRHLCNFGEKSFQSKKRAADMANSVALFYMPKTFYYHNLSPKLYKSDWFIFLSKISFTIILH